MFKYFILFAAISLASCAALFSVTGISQLFVGATISVAIMASAIEFAKIVTASALYRHWKTFPKILKYYLVAAVLVCCLITSAGIYGYLSSAYAAGAGEIKIKENQIESTNSQISQLQSQIQQHNSRISSLQGIQSQQENRLDSLIQKGRSLTTQQSSIRDNTRQISSLQTEEATLSRRLDSLQLNKLNITNSLTSSGKLGTFYYISKVMNISMDTLVKWFILILVLVFDPMSISLFITYSMVSAEPSQPLIIGPGDPPAKSEVPSEPVPAPQIEAKSTFNGPYYMDPNYDWKHDERWLNDPQARAYYGQLGIRP